MSALLAHLRAELRRRWRSWLGVVALVALVGGLLLGSLAGARRTDTAFDRMRSATDAWDVLTVPDEATALTVEAIETLPMVEAAYRALAVGLWPLDDEGTPVADDTALALAAGEPGGFTEFGRPKVLEGRLFETTEPGEIMVTDGFADRYGLRAGDRVPMGYIDVERMDPWLEAGAVGIPPLTRIEFVVSGVVLPADAVVRDEVYAYDTIYLTNAFWQEHEGEEFFFAVVVDLVDRPGVVAEYQHALRQLAPGEAIELQTMDAIVSTVERGTRPHVVALLLFSLVVGLAGAVICGQAVSRQLGALADDAGTLGALGVASGTIRGAALVRVTTLAAFGAVGSVLVAIAVSPLFPVGVARRAEVSHGFDVDVPVLAAGALVLVVAIGAMSIRTMLTVAQVARPAQPDLGLIERRIAGSSLRPVPAMGLRMALRAGDRRTPVSVRATIMGLSVASAAVIASATFGSSLTKFVETPVAYGWGWDAMIDLPEGGDESFTVTAIDAFLARDQVTGLTLGSRDQVFLDGTRVPAIGISQLRGAVGLPIVDGRAPSEPDEIALGGRTMRALGVGIGDAVVAGHDGQHRNLEVVGQAVFVGLGTYPGADRTELGKGALLPLDTLSAVGEGFGFPLLLLDAADGASLDGAIAAGLRHHSSDMEEGEVEVFTTALQPADVVSLRRVRGTPAVITMVLVVLAGAAFLHAVRATARSRRRDLALLKTLGFSRRDLAFTVAIQATVVALAGVAVGAPIGVISGRWAWTLLADRLGILPSPQVPLALLVLVIPVALLVANLAALGPALGAARTRPAAVLRSE